MDATESILTIVFSAKGLLGTCYRIRSEIWDVVTSVLTVYAPPLVESSLMLDDPRVVLNQNVM